MMWFVSEFYNEDVIQFSSAFSDSTDSKVHHGWCVWLFSFLSRIVLHKHTTFYLSILLSRTSGLFPVLCLWWTLLWTFLGLTAGVPFPLPSLGMYLELLAVEWMQNLQAACEFHLTHTQCQHLSAARLRSFCRVKRYFCSKNIHFPNNKGEQFCIFLQASYVCSV